MVFERPDRAQRIDPIRALELDHGGAVVRQVAAAPGAGDDPHQVQHLDARQRQGTIPRGRSGDQSRGCADLGRNLRVVLAEQWGPAPVADGAGRKPRERSGIAHVRAALRVIDVLEEVPRLQLFRVRHLRQRRHRHDEQALFDAHPEQFGLGVAAGEARDRRDAALELGEWLLAGHQQTCVADPVLVPRRLINEALFVHHRHQALGERADGAAEEERH